jgi:hypothetical protein
MRNLLLTDGKMCAIIKGQSGNSPTAKIKILEDLKMLETILLGGLVVACVFGVTFGGMILIFREW